MKSIGKFYHNNATHISTARSFKHETQTNTNNLYVDKICHLSFDFCHSKIEFWKLPSFEIEIENIIMAQWREWRKFFARFHLFEMNFQRNNFPRKDRHGVCGSRHWFDTAYISLQTIFQWFHEHLSIWMGISLHWICGRLTKRLLIIKTGDEVYANSLFSFSSFNDMVFVFDFVFGAYTHIHIINWHLYRMDGVQSGKSVLTFIVDMLRRTQNVC